MKIALILIVGLVIGLVAGLTFKHPAKALPVKTCAANYYLTLGFGKDLAFTVRDPNQADVKGGLCSDGSYQFNKIR